MGAGKKKPAGRPKSAPAPPGDAAAPRTLSCSLKSKKGGRQLEVAVQVPRSTPDSVLNIAADESGLSVDTGKWGGGYACRLEWPAPYAGKVRAGKDIEIEAQLSPGRLLMFFDLEKPDGAPAPGGGREAEVERSAGKKRARDEPGPNKKKREKAKEKKKTNEMKKKKDPPEAVSAAVSSEPAATKKQKRFVEDKQDVLAFVESVGGAKEAETEGKLAKEKARNEKISKIKEKQEQRKADKVGRKEKLKAALKTQVDAGKAKKSKGGKSGVAQEEAPASDKKKRRVSWGVDQEREFEKGGAV